MKRAVAAAIRLRSAIAQPVVANTSPEVVFLFRYLLVILVMVGALGGCVWSRMAVRHTALQLDATRSALARAESRHERLLVERALLREPGRLQDTADALGMVPASAILTLKEPTP